MGKLILLIVLGGVVWWLWRKAPRSVARGRPGSANELAETMVSCAHCGVHQPQSECVALDGKFYCCDAHRRAAENATTRESS